VDVGANIGVFTVAGAKQVGADGRVVAFEPNDRTRHLLAANLERHGVSQYVEVRSEAVGGSRGSRTFRAYENDLVSGFGVAPPTSYPGVMVQEAPVEVLSLSELEEPVDLIKIDVEGYEDEVLVGAMGLIERSPNVAILFEFNPACVCAAGKNPEQLIALLSQGWDLWLVDDGDDDPADRLPPFDHERWSREVDADRSWYANVLATRKE
jgi:FkbM family methyltransferase